MSKAVLVIDMPNTCAECKMVYRKRNDKREVFRCQISKKNIEINKIDNNCPLKEIPEKELDWNDGEDEYITGWNACLDEILGEDNDRN